MQTALNFAYWIKGSLSFPPLFGRQDRSHIPAHESPLSGETSPWDGLLYLSAVFCGEGWEENKGREQNNKCPTSEEAALCHVLQEAFFSG